jgi:endoglucanase
MGIRRSLLAAAVIASGTLVHTATPPNWRPGDFLLRVPVRFYVEHDSNAARQAEIYAATGQAANADAMRRLAKVSEAVWFSSGSPAEVRASVRATTRAAARQHTVPVLVAYNIPGRDCSSYSGGGAPNESAYAEWIDALARGIGNQPAVVILEPDGLALLSSEPWCGEGGGGFTGQPEDFGRVEERFREINNAIDRLRRNLLTAIYIDGGHPAWHPLNDYDAGYGAPRAQLGMASRLLHGGINRATGFFLNVSNFRLASDLTEYGSRLSRCLWLRQHTGATNCSDAELAAVDANPLLLTHFVLDTSRNGQGPWIPPAGVYSDPQDWCNPPGRGLGARPTTHTRHPLIDAYLWVKRPGESDGSCTRGTPGPEDPEYGVVDPSAGQWWPDYALGLVARANPPLPPADLAITPRRTDFDDGDPQPPAGALDVR